MSARKRAQTWAAAANERRCAGWAEEGLERSIRRRVHEQRERWLRCVIFVLWAAKRHDEEALQ